MGSGLSAVPSGSSGLSTCSNGAGSLDELLSFFTGKYIPRQITFIYHLSGNEFESAMDCLLGSISLNSLTSLLQCQIEDKAPTKLFVDLSDVWADGVGYYKCSSLDLTRPIRVIMSDQPAIDTGGVRGQFYTDVFDQFVNKHMKIFDGSPGFLRPTYTLEARSSGIFTILGKMIAHSICQDGIGFPHLSPLCYWYIVTGENKAMEFITMSDVGADVSTFVTQVCLICMGVWLCVYACVCVETCMPVFSL